MKKAVFLLTLFLAFSIALPGQTLKRSVVGSGGFIKTENGRIRSAGMLGQPVTGVYKLNNGTDLSRVVFGFWAAQPKEDGIEDVLATDKDIFNYPNPVSTSTTFEFSLAEPSLVTINIYNSIGSLVATVVNNEMYSNGPQHINWDVNGLISVSGAYSYEMIATPAAGASGKVVRYRNFLMFAN